MQKSSGFGNEEIQRNWLAVFRQEGNLRVSMCGSNSNLHDFIKATSDMFDITTDTVYENTKVYPSWLGVPLEGLGNIFGESKGFSTSEKWAREFYSTFVDMDSQVKEGVEQVIEFLATFKDLILSVGVSRALKFVNQLSDPYMTSLMDRVLVVAYGGFPEVAMEYALLGNSDFGMDH